MVLYFFPQNCNSWWGGVDHRIDIFEGAELALIT